MKELNKNKIIITITFILSNDLHNVINKDLRKKLLKDIRKAPNRVPIKDLKRPQVRTYVRTGRMDIRM